jgi:nicotinamidase-related amidase
MVAIPQIDRRNIGVLLIDVQPVFLDYAFPNHNAEKESLLVRYEHLLLLAGWMDLPLITTFEKPVAENGELPDRLEAVFPQKGKRFTKNYYGFTSETEILKYLESFQIKQIAIAGAEIDVCILQSVLGLLQLGYQVFLLEDCLFTSEPHPAPALRRMYQAGAIPSTLKSMAYELVRSVNNTPWYTEGFALKNHPNCKPFPNNFIPPEDWPVWTPKI